MSSPAVVQPSVQTLYDEGWCLIPVRPDKKPMLATWKPYQEQRPDQDMLDQWMAWNPAIWGAPTGPVSGRWSLDFDGAPGCETMAELNLTPHRATPNGGFHVDFELPQGWTVLN